MTKDRGRERQEEKKMEPKKTVRLYTRQNDKTLYQLERDGRIINQRIYVELHFPYIAAHIKDRPPVNIKDTVPALLDAPLLLRVHAFVPP